MGLIEGKGGEGDVRKPGSARIGESVCVCVWAKIHGGNLLGSK